MYTYEEIVAVELAGAEAGVTMAKYIEAMGENVDVDSIGVTFEVVMQYCRSQLISDNAKELFDRLYSDERIGGSIAGIECAKIVFKLPEE